MTSKWVQGCKGQWGEIFVETPNKSRASEVDWCLASTLQLGPIGVFTLTASSSLFSQSNQFSRWYSISHFHRYMKCSIEMTRHLSWSTAGIDNHAEKLLIQSQALLLTLWFFLDHQADDGSLYTYHSRFLYSIK